MLRPEEVVKDETIFRPDGFIVFPRSDGDPAYGPPNTVVPPKTDPEVNYYHIFGREERRHDTWRSALGEQLAQYFKAEPLSRSRTKWKLYDFPENYVFTEQRKGPQNDYRTDPYLFGSMSHRFRSTKEATDHFVWLLLDPDMNPANCKCKYCHKGPRAAKDDTPKKSAQAIKRKAEPLTASAAATSRAGRKSKDPNSAATVASETSITVRGVDMRRLTPGLTIASVPQRDQETMHQLKRGEKERFRAGEVVWCELDQPIIDPSMSERRITSWPGVVLDPSIDSVVMDAYQSQYDEKKTSIEAVSAPSKRADSPPAFGGSVHQTMSYHINFLGTLENVKVPESSLIPYLSGLIPGEIFESDAGQPKDHEWLSTPDEFLDVNLARQPHLPTPDFTKAVVAFAYAIESAAYLRGMFNLTDAYSGSDTPEGMLRDLGASSGDVNSQAAQGLRYYQGIYFGLERIWVGDVVRLRLGITDLRKLQRQLNGALVDDKAPGAPDPPAIVLDEDVSYVLQLAAIYEDPKTPKNVRVSGEMFQIMPESKYNLLKADMEARLKSLEADDMLDDAARQEEARMLQARLPQPSVLVGKPGFPPMPPLPPGFVMVSLSERLQAKIPREITLSIGHVAGRIYPSLGMHSDGPRVAEQIKQRPSDKKLAADEDTQVEVRARLSLAGLLPGCVKAMKGNGPLHTWTRGASLKASLALARQEIWNLINGVVDEEEEEEKTPKKAKKAKKEASVTPMETPVQPEKVDDATGVVDSEPSVVKVPETQKVVEQFKQNEASATAEASETDEPPLAPGWVPRQSRSHGGYYYVHVETKKTQWERPIA